MWTDDQALFSLMRTRLFPAVVGDILDTMGFLHQFLSPGIRPVRNDMVVCGRAMPVLESNYFAGDPSEARGAQGHQPFGLMFQALDDLRPDEVYVATGCAPQFALWGGLMTTRAQHLKAAGAVLDGYSRDTPELLALAVELAREVIREEITARPETLLTVVREALLQLPHQHAAIYLHPDDASLLRSYMGDQLAHAGHRIHEDFKLARGDCVLEAGGSQIDATVGMRWQRVLESLGVASAWQSTPPPKAPLRGALPPGGEETLGAAQRVSSQPSAKDES